MAGYPVEAEVVLTEKLKRYFRNVLMKADLPNDLREEIRGYVSGRRNTEEKKRRSVPYRLVKSVQSVVKEQEDGSKIYLHELLEGSDLEISGPQPVPKDPEYEARIEKLRSEQANREYREMTRNVDLGRFARKDISVKEEIRSVNKHLVAVFNFVLTVVGSFVFAYKATEYSMEKPNLPMQMCSGLIVGTIVFFADLYFIIKTNV